ncbi:MAG: LysR family transcriptional regulator [Coriobacteriia bacterium]|nr:LysR family transcriptional regulator [Coriobacteriia bacterium]
MLKKLRCFFFAAEYESFSKAGKALYISQSAVSQQVLSLEKALGTTLLNRTEKGVELTPAGEHLLKRCKPLLRELETALAEVSGSKPQSGFHLRVMYRGTAEDAVVVPLIAGLRQNAPGITVEIEKLSSTKNRMAALRNGSVDAVLGKRKARMIAGDLGFVPLCKTRLVAVVPPTNPLSNAERVTYDDLLDQPVIAMFKLDSHLAFREPSGDLRHQSLHDALTKDHRQPDLITYAQDTQSALTLAKAGAGITLIDSAWIADSTGVCILPFEEQDEDELGFFYCLSNENPALETLIKEAQAQFPELRYLGPDGRLS